MCIRDSPSVLAFVVFCTTLVCVFAIGGEITADGLKELTTDAKSLLLLISPLLFLIADGIISPDMKACMVFWKTQNVLPGHEAFSKHAHNDPRISVKLLRQSIGEWPRNSEKQNALWYRLLKKVEQQKGIQHSHRSFLLARDITCIALFYLVSTPILIYFLTATFVSAFMAFLSFGFIYFVMAFVAKNLGVRLVKNVLAESQPMITEPVEKKSIGFH